MVVCGCFPLMFLLYPNLNATSYMFSRLPIIVSVPHGGEIIAPEIHDRTLLSREDIFSDGDPLTREIYNFKKEIRFYFETSIARAAVDLNRPPDALPPENPDGVVKSHTVAGTRVYPKHRFPKRDTLRLLLQKYYHPYHEQLRKLSRNPDLFCGLDCHTMLDKAPMISKRPGVKRPFICLSNRGDRNGNRVKGRRLTCSPEMIRSLAAALKEQFPDEAENITLNSPFLGGHIIRCHSRNLPWIQIELNRRVYLSEKWFDQDRFVVCSERIRELRYRLFIAICDFVHFNFRNHSSLIEAA